LRNFGRVLEGGSQGEVRRVARASLANYARYLVDFARFGRLEPARALRFVEGDAAFTALDGCRASGRGALIVCTHFGNWDLGAAAATARGYPLSVVAESFTNPHLDRLVARTRRRAGMNVLKLEKAGPSLVRCLQRNELLAVLIDRPLAGDGVVVDFFGAPVEVPAGPARLALLTGAQLVPTAFPRRHPSRPEVRLLADFGIAAPSATAGQAAVTELTQAVMLAHERFIRECPEQWYMFREMWPDRPARGG
jgi:KDO2-lipid IV(A) lauroyltransferase